MERVHPDSDEYTTRILATHRFAEVSKELDDLKLKLEQLEAEKKSLKREFPFLGNIEGMWKKPKKSQEEPMEISVPLSDEMKVATDKVVERIQRKKKDPRTASSTPQKREPTPKEVLEKVIAQTVKPKKLDDSSSSQAFSSYPVQ
jgi:hypothetical protein